MSSPRRFELAPWRKRFLAEDGAVVPFGAVAAIFAIAALAVGPEMLRWPPHLVWGLVLAIVAAVLAAAYWLGHPRYGRGTITFSNGTMQVDQGRGNLFSAPISEIQAAMIVRRRDRERDELLLHLKGRWLALAIRLRRVVGIDDLFVELRAQIEQHGDLAAFDRRSGTQAVWILRATATCVVIAAVVALWKLFA